MVAANGKVFDIRCKHCGIVYQIIANEDDMFKWVSGSGYIQDVMGYLSAGERELLISATCNNCWENIYPPELDVDDDEE